MNGRCFHTGRQISIPRVSASRWMTVRYTSSNMKTWIESAGESMGSTPSTTTRRVPAAKWKYMNGRTVYSAWL